MQEQYTDIVKALQPYVDLYLAETLSTASEAEAALTAAAQVAPGKLLRLLLPPKLLL
jgi:S-methylmethionine-dependent homocysteine/selenocysteine methylase